MLVQLVIVVEDKRTFKQFFNQNRVVAQFSCKAKMAISLLHLLMLIFLFFLGFCLIFSHLFRKFIQRIRFGYGCGCCFGMVRSDEGTTKTFTCARPLVGQYVAIQLVGVEGSLSLCEVEVFSNDGKCRLRLHNISTAISTHRGDLETFSLNFNRMK